jgi:hypothetical protein
MMHITIFKLIFILNIRDSDIRVNTGTAATIIEALEAVVSISPLFSNTKYSTIPKKQEPASINKFHKLMRNEALVKKHQLNKGISAIICLKKAIDTGGISVRTTFVLMNEIPQNKTGRITRINEDICILPDSCFFISFST